MGNVLRKFDKKFLIFFGCIILLPILLVLVLALARGCDREITYEKYEEKMVTAAKKYIKDKNKDPKEESKVVSIKLDKLIEGNYIDSSEKLLDDKSCEGSVTVRLNGSQIEDNEGGFLNYIPTLKCKNYETNTLMSKVLNDLTETEEGLYLNKDNTYIFKGKDVDNYVEFYGVVYRIINIDENGIVKLVSVESEPNNVYWDMKYNTEVNDVKGKNIYEDSNILEKLLNYYENSKKITSKAKEKVVSYDVCIGKRAINDIGLYSESDCSKKLDNQVVSIINVTDFAKASLDPECNSIVSKSCKNYNYFHKMNMSSWTLNGVSDNTYEVYYLSSGVIYHQEANWNEFYNVVIYIDSDEIVSEGKGTITSPYKIGNED